MSELDDLRAILRRWGRCMGVGRAAEWDEDSSPIGAQHVLLRAASAVTLVTKRKLRRRSYMGIDGRKRSEPAPLNVCHGVETRSVGAKPMAMDPLMDRVDIAVLELHRWKEACGVVIRLEYCAGSIGQKEKARQASTILGQRMTSRQYRRELEIAHAWLDGRLPTRLVA